LVVPIYNAITGKFQAIQRIWPSGKKLFPEHAMKKGGCAMPGSICELNDLTKSAKNKSPIVIAEGYATAAAIHVATLHRTLAAIDCGNIKAIAEAMRAKFPLIDIIIAADNKNKEDGSPDGGLAVAYDVAREVTGVVRVAVPPPGDFADLLFKEGEEAVQKAIDAAAEPPEAETPNDEPKARPYVLVCAADVPARAKDWLWKGHLLRGALELLTGTPGLGKSQIQCSYIACVTTERPWPDGTPSGPPRNVIMVTAEDCLDQEVIPRLTAAGADRKRVYILKTIKKDKMERMFLLGEDIETLAQIIKDIGDIGLVTIDPITAYMGKLDSHRTTDVRGQLGPLAALAERMNVAFSAITHPPKAASQRAIDHFIGSQAFIAAARIGHLCIREFEMDGENARPTGRILFANPKNNPHLEMPTLSYRIAELTVGQDPQTRESITAPHVVWNSEPVDMTADQAIAAATGLEKGRGVDAKDFLKDILANGPVEVKLIRQRAEERGLSIDQLDRTKKKLHIEARKLGVTEGWEWRMPLLSEKPM
jgi:putative DNA primase/helicase